MTPRHLEVLGFGGVARTPELLSWLAEELRSRFGIERMSIGTLDPDAGWEVEGRAQLSSNRIVDALVDRGDDQHVSHTQRWTLALTDADLTAPGRDFVFGEATLGGGWAVLSTARLECTDSQTAGEERLRARLLTEAVHELGHLAGLPHCKTPGCVMNRSVTADDVDRKSPEFCAACAAAGAAA